MNKFIEKALMETYKEYSINQVRAAIQSAFDHNDFRGFSNIEGARNDLKNNVHNFRQEIFEEYILNVINSENVSNELERLIKKTYEECEDKSEVINMLKSILDGYYSESKFKESIVEAITEKILEPLIKRENPELSNIEIYGQNIEKLQSMKISGLTHDTEGSIALSNMQATISIGKVRENQEDAVLLKTHPENQEFKILLVSDGMGGYACGEKASHYAITKMEEWFDKLPSKYFKDINSLKEILSEEIVKISTDITLRYMEGGATLVGAIIGEEETLIVNVGDSRAYIFKEGKLEQITRDDSHVQDLYEEGTIKRAEDMRFHKENNCVTQAIGGLGKPKPRFYTIKNSDYEKILLFSDGVTDCLSDKDILAITRRTPKEKLSEVLVETALNNKSYPREGLERASYYSCIEGGKDNTTAAVYDRDEK